MKRMTCLAIWAAILIGAIFFHDVSAIPGISWPNLPHADGGRTLAITASGDDTPAGSEAPGLSRGRLRSPVNGVEGKELTIDGASRFAGPTKVGTAGASCDVSSVGS